MFLRMLAIFWYGRCMFCWVLIKLEGFVHKTKFNNRKIQPKILFLKSNTKMTTNVLVNKSVNMYVSTNPLRF